MNEPKKIKINLSTLILLICIFIVIVILIGVIIYFSNSNNKNNNNNNGYDVVESHMIAKFYYTYEINQIQLKDKSLIINFDVLDDDEWPEDDTMKLENINELNMDCMGCQMCFVEAIPPEEIKYIDKNVEIIKQDNKFNFNLELKFEQEASKYLNDLYKSFYKECINTMIQDKQATISSPNSIILPITLEIKVSGKDMSLRKIDEKSGNYNDGIVISLEDLGITVPSSIEEDQPKIIEKEVDINNN